MRKWVWKYHLTKLMGNAFNRFSCGNRKTVTLDLPGGGLAWAAERFIKDYVMIWRLIQSLSLKNLLLFFWTWHKRIFFPFISLNYKTVFEYWVSLWYWGLFVLRDARNHDPQCSLGKTDHACQADLYIQQNHCHNIKWQFLKELTNWSLNLYGNARDPEKKQNNLAKNNNKVGGFAWPRFET